MGYLETITDNNWKEFTASPFAVLLVTEKGCTHCKAWKAELSSFLEADSDWERWRFGVVTLDGDGVAEFKEANNPWLEIVEGLPFNAIYVNGAPTTSFYGQGVKRLVNRLGRIEGGSEEAVQA